MTRPVLGAALLTLGLATVAPWADGAWLELTDRQREQAMRVGEQSVTTEVFGAEWRVSNGSGDSVSVITPFHRLAWAARHAAFKNETVKPQEQQRILGELKERLRLEVNVVGPREDFARFLAPRLRVGDRDIAPALVQNERTAVRQENGRYLARCVYWFPSTDLTPTTRLTLILRDGDGRELSAFPIDLATMR